MNILFLQNFWHEHLGIMSLAGALKANGHAVSAGIGRDFEDLRQTIGLCRPDLIAFSCTTGEHHWALAISRRIKDVFGCPVLMGGPHPTYMPDVIQEPGIDFICVGEGEGAVVDLVSNLAAGGSGEGLLNIFTKSSPFRSDRIRPLIDDLDTLPYPDRTLYYDAYPVVRDNPVKHFMAGRGCVFDCSYCYNHQWKKLYQGKGRVLRLHRPSYCINEILAVKARYPLGLVVFEDDTFTVNQQWLREFLSEYRNKISLPFACNVNAATVTEETARLLADAGCFRVNLGVETGREHLRRGVLNKNVTDENIIGTAALLHAHDIKIVTNNMLGIPGETLDDAYETVRLNIRIKADYPWCSLLQPYPGTKIAECVQTRAKNAGERGTEFKSTFFEASVVDGPDMRKIINLQKLFYAAVKVPFFFPMIRILVHLPLRWLYHGIFLLTFFHRYRRCHKMTFRQMMVFSWRNRILYGLGAGKKTEG